MKVFFDNCTPPVFAGVLDALIRPLGHEARHIRFMKDFGFAHDTPDVEWIARLGAENDVWIVVTGDHRIRTNKAERAAWNRAGMRGFVLARSYQKMPINQAASVLLWRWPDMEQFITRAAPGSMFEMSFNRRTGFTPLVV